MESYNKQTSPILDYYRSKGILHTINATASIPEVESQIHGAIYSKML